jgi:hypothetical protein
MAWHHIKPDFKAILRREWPWAFGLGSGAGAMPPSAVQLIGRDACGPEGVAVRVRPRSAFVQRRFTMR